MSKKYWAVGLLVGLLMVMGAGCSSGAVNNTQPTEIKDNTTEQKNSQLINPKGDANAMLSASDKQEIVADAKNIATAVFGNGVKLQGLTNDDFIAKGSVGIGYSTPEPVQAGQIDATINAFKAAGYNIIDSHRPVATGQDKSGGVVAGKGTTVLVLNFQPGEKTISFSAMTKDQYTYLINQPDTTTTGSENVQ